MTPAIARQMFTSVSDSYSLLTDQEMASDCLEAPALSKARKTHPEGILELSDAHGTHLEYPYNRY